MSLELHGAIQPNKTNKGVFAGSQIVAALPRWRDTRTVSQRTKWNAGENRFLKENYRRKVFSTSFKDSLLESNSVRNNFLPVLWEKVCKEKYLKRWYKYIKSNPDNDTESDIKFALFLIYAEFLNHEFFVLRDFTNVLNEWIFSHFPIIFTAFENLLFSSALNFF